MKLKFNHDGDIHEIPLSSDKPQGKRFAIRYNGQTYYAPLVSATSSSASNFRIVLDGETLALSAIPPLQPEITSVSVNPSTVSLYQGETATATITAVANEAVQSLTYELENSPSWITNTDDVIYISPTDNDTGSAAVNVIARDTGSTTQASTNFAANVQLRPQITDIQLSGDKKATVGVAKVATLTCTHNEAAKNITYSTRARGAGPNTYPVTIQGDVLTYRPYKTSNYGTDNFMVYATDETGLAYKGNQFNFTTKYPASIHPSSANPWNPTLKAGSSGNVTVDFTIHFNEWEGEILSPNTPVRMSGVIPKQATVTGYSDGTNKHIKVIYAKKKQSTSGSAAYTYLTVPETTTTWESSSCVIRWEKGTYDTIDQIF